MKVEAKSTIGTEDLLQAIRNEFPHAEADANGRRRIFLDNAAGSMVLQRAVDAESKARRDYFPNVGEASWESKMNENTILEGRTSSRRFPERPIRELHYLRRICHESSLSFELRNLTRR